MCRVRPRTSPLALSYAHATSDRPGVEPLTRRGRLACTGWPPALGVALTWASRVAGHVTLDATTTTLSENWLLPRTESSSRCCSSSAQVSVTGPAWVGVHGTRPSPEPVVCSPGKNIRVSVLPTRIVPCHGGIGNGGLN